SAAAAGASADPHGPPRHHDGGAASGSGNRLPRAHRGSGRQQRTGHGDRRAGADVVADRGPAHDRLLDRHGGRRAAAGERAEQRPGPGRPAARDPAGLTRRPDGSAGARTTAPGSTALTTTYSE